MFSRFFIDRPIFAAVISLIITIAGFVTFMGLPITRYPDILPPTVTVSANYPGASSTVLADTVAQLIEDQVNGVEGMLYMSSTSSNNGQYQLTVTFETGTDLDMAAVRVQNAVAMVESKLPEEVRRSGVQTRKRSTNIVMLVALTSTNEDYDRLYLSNYATLRIRDELSRLEGVGDVLVFGSDYSMRIWLDPQKLKVRGLAIGDVVAAIREQNVQVAAGQIGRTPVPDDQTFQYTINVTGRLEDVSQFEDIIVRAEGSGRFIRLKDVARVELGAQSYDVDALFKGSPSAAMAIFQLPGANALEVSERVQNKMEELKEAFPQGVQYIIPFDTTLFVDAAIREVIMTLLIVAFLVIMTIYIFLQDWRASLIPSVTIPVSLLGTFAVMGLLGFSLNMITLFGIVLVIGIVVDDAIIVTENAVRNIEDSGLSPRDATVQAMNEVTGPIVATSFVLLAVFVPTAFIGGVSGELFRQFGLTIATATVFSSINALTLSPALCALVLRKSTKSRNPLLHGFNWAFDKGQSLYGFVLGGMVRRATLMIPLFIVLSVVSYWGYTLLPTGFLPEEDQGYVMVAMQLPDGAAKPRTDAVAKKINEHLSRIEGISNYVSVSGYSILDGTPAANAATFWIILDPWDERTEPHLSLEAIIGRLWQMAYVIDEARVLAFAPPAILGLGQAGGFQMELQDRGGVGLEVLQQMTMEFIRDANAHPALSNVFSSFRATEPQLFADVNRVQAKNMGIPLSDIFLTLQAYLGALHVNDFNKFGRTYQVNVQAEAPFRRHVEDVRRLEVRNSHGDMVPLGTVVNVEETLGAQIIRRYNMYPSASFSGSASHGFSSGQAMQVMEEMAQRKLPSTMGIEWTGMSYQERLVAGQAVGIFLLAVLFVYLVLCALYESWSLSFAIILAVPLALSGTVLALMMTGLDVNMYTQIGMVLLIGLASKAAILIVEFARSLRESGKSINEAALEAARLRFRPILMTALTFVLGVIPLVFATGAGGGSRRAVGTTVFGGMLSAVVLMVVFVPVFFVVLRRFSEWLSRGKQENQGL